MNALKLEFKSLITILGWSQSEAAKRLEKTPSAINHLINPNHPNKPTRTTLRLLKLIIARERPDLSKTPPDNSKKAAVDTLICNLILSKEESRMISQVRRLDADDREQVYDIIRGTVAAIMKRNKKRLIE
jgi:hypothetical protein